MVIIHGKNIGLGFSALEIFRDLARFFDREPVTMNSRPEPGDGARPVQEKLILKVRDLSRGPVILSRPSKIGNC